jgi:tRNA (cytidine/uridine-2'-O-)-methyltransferase
VTPSPLFHVALYEPEIPQNSGNVGRLSLAVQARLHLVHPLGFSTGEKAVRRAGLDYWKHVDVAEHLDAESFWRWAEGRRVYLFSSHGTRAYVHLPFAEGDVYVFGRESVGLPRPLVDTHGAWTIPMLGQTRSLNLSNAAAVVAYAALQAIRPGLFAR